METTLIVNPGSASKKYALYKEGRAAAVFRFEQIGSEYAVCIEGGEGAQNCISITHDEFARSISYTIEYLLNHNIILAPIEIALIGVRIVAPGSFFQQHARITDYYLTELKAKQVTAPLHIPHTVREVEALVKELPKARLFAASDSAFHRTMPTRARTYSIDPGDAQLHDIYRFGYHGLSVSSIVGRVHSVVGKDPARMIVAHVGGGVSLTALKDGKSIDTSMGFAPGSGVVMASRAGDIEPGAVIEIMRAKHLQYHDIYMYLQTHGGLLGLTKESDMRQIMQRCSQGDQAATEAFELYVYHIQKRIGSYIAALGGLDAIVLTATAMERNPELRHSLLKGLECFGIEIDREKNDQFVNKDGIISTIESKVKVAVMRTDEMGEMYRQTVAASHAVDEHIDATTV